MADEQNDPIIIDLGINARSMLKDIQDIIAQMRKAEGAIDDFQTKLDGFSSNDIKILITVDTGDAETKIKNLGSSVPSPVISVTADTAQAETDIESLDDNIASPTIEITADTATAESAIKALDDNAPSPTVEVTADVATAEADIRSLDSAASDIKLPVKADTSDAKADLKDIEDELKTLQTLAIINLVVNSGGALQAVDSVVKSIPGAGRILETAEAMRLFEARTGEAGKVYEDAITNIFNQNWGDSQSEVAEIAARLTQAGVAAEDLETAVVSAYNAASATGQDVNDILRVQERLVSSGLADSYTEASDIIATGFQTGADRSGDFLDTLFEYSGVFAALGMDAGTVISGINQGLDEGTFNADKFADSFKELGLKITEAVDSGVGPTFDALQAEGLLDEAQALKDGEITGSVFATAAIDAVKKSGKDFNLVEIFGTPLEDFGTNLFQGLDFSAEAAQVITPGTAEEAATTLFDTWDSSLESFRRTVEDGLSESFKIGGKPLTEILDGGKEKVQEITALLQSGESLPDALEIVLEAPGLSKDIERLGASLGNFILDFMTAIANIQEGLNIGDKGVNLRQQVAAGASTQFAYDIQIANESEIADVVRRAVDRGVDPTLISEQLNVATGELIAQGDVDKAQELIWNINQLPDAFIKVRGVKDSVFQTFDLGIQIDPNATAEQIEAAKQQAIAAYEAQTGKNIVQEGTELKFNPVLDTAGAQKAVDDTITLITAGMQNLQNLGGVFTNPIQGIMGAFNSPGGQNLTQNAGAIAAGNGAFGSVGDYLEAAKGTEAYTVPYMDMGEAADTAAVAISNVQQVVLDAEGNVVSATDAMVTGLETTATTATETALEIDTVVVSSENLATVGGAQVQSYAEIAMAAGQGVIGVWNQVSGAFAAATAALPTGATAGDGSLAGAGLWLQNVANGGNNKAGGGDVFGGGAYVTGEEGRELFFPGMNGSIMDAQQTAMLMQALDMVATGGGGTTNNYNNTTNVDLDSIFNTTSVAQSAMAGDTLARRINGMKAG